MPQNPISDKLTILRTLRGRPATKTLGMVDGCPAIVASYSDARLFTVRQMTVDSLTDLARALATIRTDEFVIRAEPLPSASPTRRRLVHDDPETGDPATFVDVPRRWLLLDVDDLPCPDDLDPLHPMMAGCHAREQMPEPFRDAAAWVALTSSAGLRPGIRCRLGFWLDRPVDSAELVRWLAEAPVDPAAFRAVQPIFMAAPVILPGAVDPCRRYGRVAVLAGELEVEVPDLAVVEQPVARVEPGHGMAWKRLEAIAGRLAAGAVGERTRLLWWASTKAIELDADIPREVIAARLIEAARHAGMREPERDLVRQVRNAFKAAIFRGAA